MSAYTGPLGRFVVGAIARLDLRWCAIVLALLLQACALSDDYYVESTVAEDATEGSGPLANDTPGDGPSGMSEPGEGPSGDEAVFASGGCDGFLWQSACWRVGERGENCRQVCAEHGGATADLESLVGSEAQGGTLEACQIVLHGLGVTDPVQSDTRHDVGIGCHLLGRNREPTWLREPDFSVDSSLDYARLVCGCVD